MKFERLVVEKFKVVCCNGIEMVLEPDTMGKKDYDTRWPLGWNLVVNEEASVTVTEIYDVAKGILEQNKKTIEIIFVEVLGEKMSIKLETTKEEFLTSLIGDVQCLSKITQKWHRAARYVNFTYRVFLLNFLYNNWLYLINSIE